MSIAVLSVRPGQGEQRPLDRQQPVGHPDRLDGGGVGVCPARELVEVVADARDLAAALPLDGEGRRGPGLGPRHRQPQQRGGRHSSRRRLLLPGGVLRPRDAGGDHNGAPLSHERTGAGVRGTGSPVRLLPRQRREKPGVRRGAQHPLARAQCLTLGMLA